MNFKILLSIIYLTSTVYIGMPVSAYANSVQNCKDGSKQLQDQAKETANTSNTIQNNAAQQAGSLAGTDINQGSQIATMMNAGSCDLNNQTVANLQEAYNKCSEACNPSKASDDNSSRSTADEAQQIQAEMQSCQKAIQPYIQAYQTGAAEACQAAEGARQVDQATRDDGAGGGGGMSPMMAGLLGAALGAGAAMLLNKKKDKDKEKEKEKDEDPVDEEGNVDCSKAGSEVYSDCNEHFVQKCKDEFSSEECQNFSNRYCTAGSSNTSTEQASNSTPATSNSGIIIASAEDKDIKGEGVGSNYCFNYQATNYCATAGRETCPSCLQLETNKAAACKANPAICIAQNSPAEIEEAKKTCPSDPMFSNPDYVAGGGSTVPDVEGLSDPILPDYYSSSEGYSGGGDPLTPPTDNDSHSVIGYSIGDEVAGDGSSQDSYSSGSSGSSETAQGGVTLSDPVLPSSATIASTKRNPTSAGGEMGPSLFSMSSAIIESRCKKRQLAHCLK